MIKLFSGTDDEEQRIGTSYIRWGRTICENDGTLVYKGTSLLQYNNVRPTQPCGKHHSVAKIKIKVKTKTVICQIIRPDDNSTLTVWCLHQWRREGVCRPGHQTSVLLPPFSELGD